MPSARSIKLPDLRQLFEGERLLKLSFETNVKVFLEKAHPFLCKEEAENYFAFSAIDLMESSGGSLFQGLAHLGEEVVGVFWVNEQLVLGLTKAPQEVLSLLATTLSEKRVPLTGVLGPLEAAENFGRLWPHEGVLSFSSSVLKLQSLIPPRKTKGRIRFAGVSDKARVASWTQDFAEETGLELSEGEAERQSEESISAKSRYVWECAGEVVSMALVSTRTPSGARIHWVYTPPGFRKRGFASALVGALSQQLLGSGFPFCFVVTGPESSRVYKGMGYALVRSLAFWEFKAQSEDLSGSHL
jgi:uncharacterized protein